MKTKLILLLLIFVILISGCATSVDKPGTTTGAQEIQEQSEGTQTGQKTTPLAPPPLPE